MQRSLSDNTGESEHGQSAILKLANLVLGLVRRLSTES